jgi:hypothetical protein
LAVECSEHPQTTDDTSQQRLMEKVPPAFSGRGLDCIDSLKYSHSLTYVRVVFRGTLRKLNLTYVGISLNAYAALATMHTESDWSKNRLISKENVIKHSLLSNLITFIYYGMHRFPRFFLSFQWLENI